MRQRGWRDIIAHMLELVKQPIKKMRLMNGALLPVDGFREYLALTEKNGLIKLENGKYVT